MEMANIKDSLIKILGKDKTEEVYELAKSSRILAQSSTEQLQALGINKRLANKIVSLFAFRSSSYDLTKRITSSNDIQNYFRELEIQPVESMHILCLSMQNEVIGKYQLSLGGVGSTTVPVKTLIKKCLLFNASAVIMVHNHPSGNLSPSKSDIAITKKVKESLALVDITLLDHLIIAGNSYTSFADDGLL